MKFDRIQYFYLDSLRNRRRNSVDYSINNSIKNKLKLTSQFSNLQKKILIVSIISEYE